MNKIKKIIVLIFAFVMLFSIAGCKKNKNVIFEITFISEGLDIPSIEYSKDDSSIKLPTPSREGYIFNGWYFDASFNDPAGSKIDSSLEKDITLYAYWEEEMLPEPAEVYTITFDEVGGTIVNDIQQTEGTEIFLPSTSKTGYQFDGWYLNGELYSSNVMPSSNITLVAKWTQVYTITFNTMGGSNINPITQPAGTKVELAELPTKTGFVFNGWTYKGQPYELDEMPSENIILLASWTKVYKISFVGVELDDLIFTGEEEVILPVPELDGYLFEGWYTSYAFSGDPITKIDAGTKRNYTLIAKLTECYKISYDVDNGQMPSSYPTMYYPEIECVLPIPTRVGYAFVGWTENPNSEVIEFMESVPLSYAENLTLTAIWEKVTYNVTYILGDGLYADYKQLYVAFFSDFYYYIRDYRGATWTLEKSGAYTVNDFLDICSAYTGGSAGMSQIGNHYGSYYLKIDVGGKIEDQTSDDGFVGYCLENNMYVDFIYFIADFFYYWRLEEGYTNGPSDPDGTGSDFLASAWASIVDTAKFFYYSPYAPEGDPHRLPSYFFREGYKVPTFYENIPYVLKNTEGDFVNVYDWETGLELPQSLVLDGYKFIGWYDNPEFEGEMITSIEAGIFEDITVYAKIEKEE